MSDPIVLAKRRAWMNLKKRLAMNEEQQDEIMRILKDHIRLDWLHASDGHPDIVGMYVAAGAIAVRFEPYIQAFRREEERADALGRQVDDLKAALQAYFDHLQKSINVGPLTKQPTKEAALLRRLRDLISAPDLSTTDLSDGLPHLNRNE